MMLGNRGSRSFFTERSTGEMGNHTNKWLQTVSVQYFVAWSIGKRKASLSVEGSFHFKAMYGKDKSFFCNVSFFKTGRDKERSVCLVMAHSFSLLLDTGHSAFTKISQIDTW